MKSKAKVSDEQRFVGMLMAAGLLPPPKAKSSRKLKKAPPCKYPDAHIGYICSPCAARLGGVWPKGHCATFHTAICPECGKTAGLGSVDDWDWPRGSKCPEFGAGRD